MGMFDTINVPCPKCKTKSGFQTKSGDCRLALYELDEAPADAMKDVMGNGPVTCESCGTSYGVVFKIVSTVVAKSIKWPPPKNDDDDGDDQYRPCDDCRGSGSIGDPANRCVRCDGLGIDIGG